MGIAAGLHGVNEYRRVGDRDLSAWCNVAWCKIRLCGRGHKVDLWKVYKLRTNRPVMKQLLERLMRVFEYAIRVISWKWNQL